MTTAEDVRDHIRDHGDDERVLDTFREFGSQIEKHEITLTDDRNLRCISRMTFLDQSFLDINLTGAEDQLAFVPQGWRNRRECVMFHPEDVGARLFDLVDSMQAELRLHPDQPVFDVPRNRNILWHALKITEERVIRDWKPQDGPQPQPDPSGANDPRMPEFQTLHAVPLLTGHLEALRAQSSLEDHGLMLDNLSRNAAATLLERILQPEERERLEGLTRRILKESRGETPED